MRVYIVAEDAADVRLLERVLPPAARRCVELLSGGGGNASALSLARSVRIDTGEPVILLVNARAVDEKNIAEQRWDTEFLLTSVGPPVRAELMFAIPELEVVLFHDPAVLERVLGMEIPERARIEARFIPKQVLAELIAASGRFADASELIAALGDDDARRLAEHPLIRQLEGLIADMQAEPVPAELRLRRAG